ncbi:MAG: hypothetical protein RLZZ546_2960 [Bacteroidota bacterium]|jgi:dolichol-phosphate mannosyltransferase
MSKLSIILLSYQSSQKLIPAYKHISLHLEKAHIPFEVIIVDDGSKDNSFQIAQQLENEDTRVMAIQLAKNYTSPYAQFAGLEVCMGSCASPMPDDFQRPIEHVIEMYRQWEKGNKIIIGYRKKRDDGWLSDIFSNLYYGLMNKTSGTTFPKGGSDGYLIDREIINLLNKGSKKNTTPTIELLNIGYNPVLLGYDRPIKQGKSRWTYKKRINLAMDTFFSGSKVPLRFISFVGIFMFLASFVLIVAIVLSKLFSDNTLFGLPIQGWATLVVLIALFNGFLLLSIGIVSEYLWRMYEELKGRPPYIIKSRKDE